MEPAQNFISKDFVKISTEKINLIFTEAEKICKSYNVELIYVISPNQALVENLPDRSGHEIYRQGIRSILEKRLFIDLNDEFILMDSSVNSDQKVLGMKSLFLNESKKFGKGSWHPNELGNRKMAESAAETIVLDTIVSEFSF